MAPQSSTARWMPLHKGLYAQNPQHWHEAEQPASITFGRLQESGQRRGFKKHLCFKTAFVLQQGQPPRANQQCSPMAQVLHLPGFQSGCIHTPAPLHMDEGWGNAIGESNSHEQKEGDRGRQVWVHGLALLPQKQSTASMAIPAETDPDMRVSKVGGHIPGDNRFLPMAVHWKSLQCVPA